MNKMPMKRQCWDVGGKVRVWNILVASGWLDGGCLGELTTGLARSSWPVYMWACISV